MEDNSVNLDLDLLDKWYQDELGTKMSDLKNQKSQGLQPMGRRFERKLLIKVIGFVVLLVIGLLWGVSKLLLPQDPEILGDTTGIHTEILSQISEYVLEEPPIQESTGVTITEIPAGVIITEVSIDNPLVTVTAREIPADPNPIEVNITVVRPIPAPASPTLPPVIKVPVYGPQADVKYEDISSLVQIGAKFGNITIPRLEIQDQLVRYGRQAEIDKGLCQFNSWELPGDRTGVSMVAAHNYNPIWKIGNLQEGDMVYYSTIYGDFTYRVVGASILNDGRDLFWYKGTYYKAKQSQLVFMTCYPFDADGLDGRRYLVYCDLISGPEILSPPDSIYDRWATWESFGLSHKVQPEDL